MSKISTYPKDTNVTGQDLLVGSDWNTPGKITKNFSTNALASYFNKSAIIDTGQFSWEFLPYNNTQPQPEKTFMKVDWLDDTININNLAGVLRVSALTLGNTQPGAFIENEWVGNNILIHLPNSPSAYAIYTVDSLVPDGDWYYLMTLSYVGGQSFTILKNEPVVMGYFAGANVITEITGTFPIIVSEGSIPDVSIDPTVKGEWDLAYDNSIVSAAVTGTSTKTLTLIQQDGGTITASWTDEDTNLVTSVFGRTGAVVAVSGDYNTSQVTESTNLYFTQARAIASPITGYNPTLGTITATDTILTAINKLAGSYVPYTGATNNVNLGEKGITAGYVGFDLTPTGTPTAVGTMYWDAANRTVALVDGDGDTTLQIGQEERILVHNNTGSTLTDGQLVYVTGSTGNLPSVALASAATESTSAATIGMITETILNGADGFITVSGIVNGLNTLAFNEGDLLWLSDTPGGFTTTKPISPSHLVLIGYVIKKAGGNGSVLVKIQNTQELSESSDVLISAPEIDGQGLFLQTISGVQLWRNRSIVDVLGYTPADEATTLTINGTSYDLSANRTWSVGTVTSIAVGLGTSGTDVNVSGSPITSSGTITLNIPSASSVNRGLLTPTDWTTFNNKQDAGNYITSLTGEATASGPGAAAVTLSTPAVTGKLLTGVNITGGTVVATDTILEAFGKVQNQINGLVGGSIYKGTWNAATNTPTITSGVGNTGWYYIVSVSGSTNIDGITDWNLGDWIIFDGTAWQQVDNTDAVVSVNGYTGAVSLVSSDVPEGLTNLYFTNARARGAVSLTTTGSSGAATYDSVTGVFNIPNYAPDLSGYVPYTGATGAVNLGPYDLTVNGVLVGKGAGTGGESVILGYEALRLNTTGYRNVAIGARPLWNNTTGVGNVAIGAETLISAISGNINIAIGDNTAKYITTGSYNTVIGPGSGLNGLTTGSYNTIIGGSIASFGDVSNNIVLADGQGNIKYKWDGTNNNFYGNAIFSGNITASTIVKSGGTSSQFLKADGSIDSTAYLPLAGGTLTGGLNGTFGNFSSYVNAQTIDISNSTAANALRITHTNGSYHAVSIVATGNSALYASGNVTVVGTITSTGVISAQSGLANGIGQSFALPTTSGTLALTSQLSSYLPLSGGTLTGALSGTSATFTGTSASSVLTLANSSGGTKADFTITENTGLIINSYEGASARSINLQVGGASALSIATSGAATFSSSVTASGGVNAGDSKFFNSVQLTDSLGGTCQGFLWTDAANTLKIGTGTVAGGNVKMTITSAGNIGIGTTSPSGPLQVNRDGVSEYSTVRVTNANSTADAYLGVGGSSVGNTSLRNNAYVWTSANTNFIFGTNDTERMRITSGGNVGIGTTTISTNSLIRELVIGQGITNGVTKLSFRSESNSLTSDISLSSYLGENLMAISTTSNIPMLFVTNSTERMRITSGGNVLIGTTTDAGYKLDVNGTGVLRNALSVITNDQSTARIKIINTSAATSSGYGLVAGKNAVTHDGFSIYDITNNITPLYIASSGAATFSSSVTATSFFESSSVVFKNILATNPITSLDVDVIKYKRTNVDVDDVRYGYSAEQINSIMPELTNKEVTAVKYLDVHTLLIAELQREIKELKSKLN